MSLILKSCVFYQSKVVSRSFSCTGALCMKQWRLERGLPVNRNAEGFLTDGPDYTYLDGRPTPLLHKQKKRIDKQRAFATKIVEMCSELDFAKDRYQKTLRAIEDERQNIIANRLKPKGSALYKKN